MRKGVIFVFIVAAVAGFALNAAAQKAFKYDAAQEITFSGSVSEVVPEADASGQVGLHLVIKTDKGLVAVRIGPAMFVGVSNFYFLFDDRVEVVGMPLTKDQKTVVARTVTKAGNVLTLRDAAGTPAWEAGENGTDGCGITHVTANVGTN